MAVVTVARALRELEAVYGITGATVELSRDGDGSLAMLLPRQAGAPAITGRGATAAAAIVALHLELERLALELVATIAAEVTR